MLGVSSIILHNPSVLRIADIEQNLRTATESGVWQRGRHYHLNGAVKSLSFEADPQYPLLTARATVQGSELYNTRITINTDENLIVHADCDCPYAIENEFCKHIAALGIALCARMRATLQNSDMHRAAHEIATALEYGQLPATDMTSLGGDNNVPAAALVADWRPFGQRFALILALSYERPQAFLSSTPKPQDATMSGAIPFSREMLRTLLTDTSMTMSPEERALMTYLSTHDIWSRDCDLHQILMLARDAKIGIYRDSTHPKNRMTVIEDGRAIPASVTMIQKQYEVEPFARGPRSHAYFECTIEAHNKHAWIAGTEGFVSIQQQHIRLLSTQAHACTLMKRLRETGFSSSGATYSTHLTAVECIHINEILADLGRCFVLITALKPEFVVTEYEQCEPTLLIDYNAEDSKLSLRGAVDYGCEILDVSDAWQNNPWSGSARLMRRSNPVQNPLLVSIDDNAIGYAHVNVKQESAVYQGLAGGYGCNKRGTLSLTGTKKIEHFLEHDWESLLALGWKIIFTRDPIKYSSGDVRTDITADLDATRDWLAFDLSLYCGKERVRLEDIVAFIERGDECLKTEDGRLIRVTNKPDLERIVRMLERFSKNASTGAYEGKLYNAPEVADIASNSPHYRTQYAKSFKAFMKEVQSGRPVKRVPLPTAHKKLLRPYQVRGVEWMHFLRSYRFGGILADEMGLGKTIQALSHISIHKQDGESSLVIAPKTLLHNWAREARERFPELSVRVIEGTAAERRNLILQDPTASIPPPHLYITSYPLAQRDLEIYKARTKPFHYLLLDEAQSIKNPRTKNAHAVKAIPAEYRIALTGTPLENSVEELWSVFDFLMPGFLGPHATFQKHFGKPIMEHGDARALAHLKSKTSAFMLRRAKTEVLKELPAKIETPLQIELNDDQNILYQAVLARTRSDLFAQVADQGFKRSQIHILAALTKLRQICNHPSLVEPNGNYSSAKLDACMEIVHEIRSERRKVLIFSQFTGMLDIIAKRLEDEKVLFSTLTGKTNHRQELVDAFNSDPSITVFLISLKAGGTGLNLTSADTVIVFDPWWNPAVENQAIDRAHRIGQKKTVNVYRLVTQGTIEEKILALQSQKRALFDALVQENAELFKKLTWDDVQGLFRS